MEYEEFIKEFAEEALVHVNRAEQGLLQIEQGNQQESLINELFRAVHSVKGTAGFFGLTNIIQLAHSMENLLGHLRNQTVQVSPRMVDALLEANDNLRSMIMDIEHSEHYPILDHVHTLTSFVTEGNPNREEQMDLVGTGQEHRHNKELVLRDEHGNKIVAFLKDTKELTSTLKYGRKLYQVKLDADPSVSPINLFKTIESIGTVIDTCKEGNSHYFLCSTVLEASLVAAALGIEQECIVELSIEADEIKKNQVSPVKEGETSVSPTLQQETGGEENLRVNLRVLNDLLNLAGEMVLARNQLVRILDGSRKTVPGLDPVLQSVDRLTTEMQEKIMQTRMQPIAHVFNKFPRIVRDLAKTTGKDVVLALEGTDVELDKSIIEGLTDPLTHLVRNALDHGIESEEVRRKKGKLPQGKIVIKAYYEGSQVKVEVIDDGGGLDRDKIKQEALNRNVISPLELASMGEGDLLRLIFRPGFSTAQQITDVSGRGVGMDVVKTNIEKLGGSVDIRSTVSQGCCFQLTLPLTLAIIPSLIVEAANQRFALPQTNLQEMVRIKRGQEGNTIEYIQNSPVLRLRGDLVPLIYLTKSLGLDTVFGQEGPEGTIIRIVILKLGDRKFGLVVDAVHDQEDILVKPLPKYVQNCRCYFGVTIMGDGRIAMILDPEGLAEESKLRFAEAFDHPKQHSISSGKEEDELHDLLLFTCPGNEVLGIDLSRISRVEKIRLHQINTIGDKEYLQFEGRVVRLIRPEQYLPLAKGEVEQDRMYVIIPKYSDSPVGLVAKDIYDSKQVREGIGPSPVEFKGFGGSMIIDNRIVLLLDLDGLYEVIRRDNFEGEGGQCS